MGTGADTRPKRTTFVLDKDITARAEAGRVCEAVLDLLRPHLRTVSVDAYSDYQDQMPPEVVTVEATLKELGRRRGRGDPGMGVELDPVLDDHWVLLRAYAAWSINVDLLGEDGRDLGCFHDCAYSVVAELTTTEAQKLSAELRDIAPVVPLAAVHARRRAARDEARSARRDRRRAMISRLLLPVMPLCAGPCRPLTYGLVSNARSG